MSKMRDYFEDYDGDLSNCDLQQLLDLVEQQAIYEAIYEAETEDFDNEQEETV